MWNAYYIYGKYIKNIPLLEFRERVITSLINNELIGVPANNIEENQTFHFLEPNPSTENEISAMKRCRMCTKKKQSKKTRYFCPMSPDKPGLCVHPCFKDWHCQ